MPRQDQGPIQIPLAVDLEMRQDISNTHTLDAGVQAIAFIKNGIVQENKINGTRYVERRPGFDVKYTLNSNRDITNILGLEYIQEKREFAVVYYDGTTSSMYLDYDGISYDLGYNLSRPVEMAYITSGGKDYIFIVATYTQATANRGLAWVFEPSTTTLTRLVVGTHGFPDTTEQMARGAIHLDTYAFVLSQSGKLYNSNVGDILTWTSTDFLISGDAEDHKMYLAKHHDHIVVVGTQNITFYYDAGNPSGSPLAIRKDLTIPIGVLSSIEAFRYTVSIDHDDEYVCFIGATGESSLEIGRKDGGIGVYIIKNFRLQKVSTPSVDLVLTKGGPLAVGPSVNIIQIQGRKFLVVSTDVASGSLSENGDLVYDIEKNYWYLWSYGSLDNMGLSLASGPFMIGKNSGDAVMRSYINHSKDEEYDHDTSTTTTSIFPYTIQIPQVTLGSTKNKFCRETSLLGDYTDGQEDVEISWTDDNYQTFSTARTYDLQNHHKLSRCGMFRKRAWKIHQDSTTTGSRYPVRLSHIEIDVKGAVVNTAD